MELYNFEIFFVAGLAAYLVCSVVLLLKTISDKKSKKIGAFLINFILSLLVGGGLLFGLTIISLLSQFINIPIEYGLKIALVISPISAIATLLILTKYKIIN
jgi:hypothetical protein